MGCTDGQSIHDIPGAHAAFMQDQRESRNAQITKDCERYGHRYQGRSDCMYCDAPYQELTDAEQIIAAAVKYELYDEAGRDEHAERVGRKIAKALGLTEVVTDDVGGPEWAQYSRWVTPTIVKHGPRYLASEAT